MKKRWNKLKKSIKKTVWTVKFFYRVMKLIIDIIFQLSEHNSNQRKKNQQKNKEFTDNEKEKMKKEILADLKELEDKFENREMKITLETLMRKDQLKIRDPQNKRDHNRRTNLYLKTLNRLKHRGLIIEKETGELKISKSGLNYLKQNM